MALKSSLRTAVVAACLLVAVAVMAGTSAGSPPSQPRATAPRLIAHDTSGFSASKRPVRKKPAVTHAKTRTPARSFSIHNDSTTNTSVTNSTGDIGMGQYVQAINGTVNVYSRTRNLRASASSASFWSGLTGPDAASLCGTSPQGQASVSYDEAADRWVISEAAFATDNVGAPVAPYVQCVAVSTSSDATGTWNRYVFQVSATLFPDRPTVAVWADGYYLSFNQHTSLGTWAGAGALALERSKMLTGAAAQARYFDLENVTPGLGGMLPADINGTNQPTAGAPELYLQAHDDPLNINDRLEIWGFHVDWTAPVTGSTFQPIVNLPLDPLGFTLSTSPCACLGQQVAGGGAPSTQHLDSFAQAYSDSSDALPQLGGRLQWGRSSGGDETLTATATEDVGLNQVEPAWFQLENIGGAGWSVNAKGVYNPGGSVSRFLPSAAFDNSGNVGLAYATTGSTAFPGLAYTNATNGAFAEGSLGLGSVPYTTSTAYGRYTALSLDPITLCTFWFTGPMPDSALQAVIGTFSFPGCVASASQRPIVTVDPSWTAPLVREGLSITGNSATFSGATTITNQWRRCDSRGLNCVDIPGETASTHTMTVADAAGDRTLRFQQTATNANGSSTVVSTATTLVQSIAPVNVALPVVSGTAQSGRMLSTTNGTWTSSSPVSYTYRWRRCTSGVCANIAGANSATYTLTDSDVGSTVDAVVSATNTGGGTDANAPASATVSAVPASGGSGSGGGGGGGGGGGAGSPDLQVTGFASASTPAVGDDVMFGLSVFDANSMPAQTLLLTVALSSGLQFISGTSDRGNGCHASGTSQVVCNLDWLSGDAQRANVQIFAKVAAAGQQVLTATAMSQQGVLKTTDNSVSLTLNTPTTAATTGVPAGLNGDGTASTKPTTRDKVAPSARALGSAARRGGTAKLRFHIYDDRGVAMAVATVKRNGKTFATSRSGFGPVAFGTTYFLGWHVPALAPKGRYTFCVVALDRAGNHSRSSCAALALK